MGRRGLETKTPHREWVVEYYAKVGEETTHHLSVLQGDGMEDVQRMLMQELRATYHEAGRFEVWCFEWKRSKRNPTQRCSPAPTAVITQWLGRRVR